MDIILIVVMVSLCIHRLKHIKLYFKYMQFIVNQLYLNKAVFKSCTDPTIVL
jgi:hypothetical protein